MLLQCWCCSRCAVAVLVLRQVRCRSAGIAAFVLSQCWCCGRCAESLTQCWCCSTASWAATGAHAAHRWLPFCVVSNIVFRSDTPNDTSACCLLFALYRIFANAAIWRDTSAPHLKLLRKNGIITNSMRLQYLNLTVCTARSQGYVATCCQVFTYGAN